MQHWELCCDISSACLELYSPTNLYVTLAVRAQRCAPLGFKVKVRASLGLGEKFCIPVFPEWISCATRFMWDFAFRLFSEWDPTYSLLSYRAMKYILVWRWDFAYPFGPIIQVGVPSCPMWNFIQSLFSKSDLLTPLSLSEASRSHWSLS
jgi:hypothetical protein